MAGYMNTQFGNIYEGQFRNGAAKPIPNGTIVVLDPATKKMVLPAADADMKFTCMESLNIFDGIPAYDFRVDAIPENKVYYFVENTFDGDTSGEYDTAKVEVPVDKFVRAHPLQVGDKFCAESPNTLTEMTQYSLKADGVIG